MKLRRMKVGDDIIIKYWGDKFEYHRTHAVTDLTEGMIYFADREPMPRGSEYGLADGSAWVK
jgi:hypothetical protein